ncbi:putative polyketide synthase [Whalleya microplaca]|nr:putative polyketide synthase [Whalleya microplaca]
MGDHKDPICIVGMACRLPGDIRSPSDLWDFLIHKKSAQGVVPLDRFDGSVFYDDHDNQGGSDALGSEGGYFLKEDVRRFDNSFFGINNLEATHGIKLLEIVFECFESAGITLDQVSGSNTGVYVGNFTHDFFLMRTRDPDSLHRYDATGTGATLIANRVSHVFNLHGPSLTLDTACSSSLYSLHVAVSALQAGECDGAIAAGVNLILTPETHVAARKAGILSPDSSCKTFDSLADGYGRGEGVNAVYLKRLSSAIRNQDEIFAVIRGTAVNSNGRTPGIAQPSTDLQEAVIRKAYKAAGIGLDGTDYIECHGTGTAVGDPIEVEALGRCFSSNPSLVMIGSVKPNLGHSEAASGLTSLIKATLAFRHGLIPPTRGINALNPQLDLSDRNMKVVTEVEHWPRRLRRASLNAFGYGGANAHCIIESVDSFFETASPNKQLSSGPREQHIILPLSAASKLSLEARRGQVSQMIESCDAKMLDTLAHTLVHRRSQLRHRGFVLATATSTGRCELCNLDVTYKNNESQALSPLPVAFIFTGQGAQYAGMAKELLSSQEVFRSTIVKLDGVLQSLPPEHKPKWTLRQAILEAPESSQVNQVTHSQPLCTALQIALVDLLRDWGINPSVVIGHSSGEIAAAYTAGIHSAAQAITVAYYRGVVADQLQTQGAMIATSLNEEDAAKLIASMGFAKQICIACINSPDSITLSGSREAIFSAFEELQSRGQFARLLSTGGKAYHSDSMRQVGELFEDLIRPYLANQAEARVSKAEMQSSVGRSGSDVSIVDGSVDMAKYWRDNLEKPVQFNAAVQQMAARHNYHLIEVGPHSALKGPIHQIRSHANMATHYFPYSPSLSRNQNSELCMKRLAGDLFLRGHQIEWHKVNRMPECARTQIQVQPLPPYPWDYSGKLLWVEPRSSRELRSRPYRRHELLGSRQLATNGFDYSWRNVLNLDELFWLRDHKVEDQIVFPAACYLALAIEALSHIQDLRRKADNSQFAFKFFNTSINTALVLPDGINAELEDVEIHTTMSRRRLSVRSISTDIYDFNVSSWISGQSTVHCVGSVRLVASTSSSGRMLTDGIIGFRRWSLGPWYDKSQEEGLVFGPHFQSLTELYTDKYQTRSEVKCTTQIEPSLSKNSTTYYAIHPVTIDACLQVRQLRPYLPVFLTSCCIQPMGPTVRDGNGVVYARAEKTGFTSLRAECKLYGADDTLVLHFEDLRLSLYTELASRTTEKDKRQMQSNPFLQVVWKPDISQLFPGMEEQLDAYITTSLQESRFKSIGNGIPAKIATLIDLIGHKNPRMRVLQLGSRYADKTEQWLAVLDHPTAFPRCRSWYTDTIKADGSPAGENASGLCDYVLTKWGKDTISKAGWKSFPGQLPSLIGDRGLAIFLNSEEAVLGLNSAGFEAMVVQGQLLLAVPKRQKTAIQKISIVIITHNPSPLVSQLTATLTEELQQRLGVLEINSMSLLNLDVGKVADSTLCISLVEIEHKFLVTMAAVEMDHLRTVTESATNLLWLTGANMLANPDPDLSLVNGFARALMMEHPKLNFTVIDVGPSTSLAIQITCNYIKNVISEDDDTVTSDKEFILSNGLLYVSRISPDVDANTQFRRRMKIESPVQDCKLSTVRRAQLSIGQAGLIDTLHFQEICFPPEDPPPGFVDVAVKAVSLNAKDVYVVSGIIDTRNGFLAHELGGVVVSAGAGVDLSSGDRVVVATPNHFTTTERVPAWAVKTLLPGEDFGTMATLPVVYGSALYALRDCAHLRAGESVMIHSGAGAFGIAAITLAQQIGAIVYTTVGSSNRRRFLVKELNVPGSHIFNSRDESFVEDLHNMTNGRGVDVVVNSLTGALMHASWGCLANFGRFVEIGKREFLDAGKLEMDVFLRNVSFSAFDLDELFFSDNLIHRDTYCRLFDDVFSMYRSGHIKPVPITRFEVADISKAYRYFSSRDRIGKIVISLENDDNWIPTAPSMYRTVLDPDKVYLLVGCLGGLGRSLSGWMFARGARQFVFLGRTGCDKDDAKQLVSYLQSAGARVAVVRGDVSIEADVHAAVATCTSNGCVLGGIVQAAMWLHEDLFIRMEHNRWHNCIRPKWEGTWNLHHAIKGIDEKSLDFFLLTSSLAGSVGVATESNYCAANAFLDAFARWRRSQGKVATSIGLGAISEVGYLHENPKIEALTSRRGTQLLTEEEFLQAVDLAICSTDDRRSLANSHILTGLETNAALNLLAQGFEVTHAIMDAQPASILAASFEAIKDQGVNRTSRSMLGETIIPMELKDLPQDITGIIMAEKADTASLRASIIQRISHKFSNLILLPMDRIEHQKSFAQYGVDSMIASEFRTWFWNTFRVDIPFFDLLSPQKNLETAAELVESKLMKVVETIYTATE